jgi:hypothetical protein
MGSYEPLGYLKHMSYVKKKDYELDYQFDFDH